MDDLGLRSKHNDSGEAESAAGFALAGQRTVMLDTRFMPAASYAFSEEGLSFEISGAAAFLVECGNTSFFGATQRSFSLALSDRVATRITISDLQGAFTRTCYIVVAVCNDSGDVVRLERLGLHRSRSVAISADPACSKACIFLRLRGGGRFRSIDVLSEQPGSAAVEAIRLVPSRPQTDADGSFGSRLLGQLRTRLGKHVDLTRWAEWENRIGAVKAKHRHRTNSDPKLFRPILFSEKMQWRKLFDAKPLYTRLSDKAGVRWYIAENGFADLLIPILWLGDDPKRIPLGQLPRPFIIKSTHASAHVIKVQAYDVIKPSAINDKAQGWLDLCFGTSNTTPGYVGVPRRLIVEPLLRCRNGSPPIELKLFVFGGKVRFLEYLQPLSESERHVSYLSADWQDLGWRWHTVLPVSPPPPQIERHPRRSDVIERSFRVAETLCRDIDHCRVDFYVKDDQLFVGEMTLYSWSGWPKFKPSEVDAFMGSFWTIRWPTARALYAILFKHWGR